MSLLQSLNSTIALACSSSRTHYTQRRNRRFPTLQHYLNNKRHGKCTDIFLDPLHSEVNTLLNMMASSASDTDSLAQKVQDLPTELYNNIYDSTFGTAADTGPHRQVVQTVQTLSKSLEGPSAKSQKYITSTRCSASKACVRWESG